MSSIIITFICDFTKSLDVKKDEGKYDKVGKATGKGMKNAEEEEEIEIINKKQEEILIEKKKDEKNEPDIKKVVIVKKPKRFLHIEYNLLPGKNIYKIDVIFWGSIAKVYTNDGIESMKSINKDGHYWVAFSIRHKITFDENDLRKLASHQANFLITSSKTKLTSSVAKKDANKENTFYFEEKDIELKSDFAKAYGSDPNVNKHENIDIDLKTRNINDVKCILKDLLNFSTRSEPITDLFVIPDDLHQKTILSVINKVSNNRHVAHLNSIANPIDVTQFLAVKKGKGKKEVGGKSKMKKEGQSKKNDVSQISVSGETYFTCPYMTMFDLKLNNNDISSSYLSIHVNHLMNADQKHNLKPLIIKVDQIKNIPRRVLHENGFSLMYVSYNLGLINYKTGARYIDSNQIRYNDHHIYFTKKSYENKLAEIIQNDFLVFQIHGVRLSPNEKQASLFGQKINDKTLSTPLQNTDTKVRKYIEEEIELNKKSVLLAVARVSLTELLQPFWILVKVEECVHPRRIRHLNENCDKFKRVTINEINIETDDFDQNPLTDSILLTSGLSIKIGVQMLNPIIHILDEMIDNVSVCYYNRILLVIYDSNITKTILFNLFIHNDHWLQRSNISPNYLYKKIPDKDYAKNALTGFSIGCVDDNCIIFLEGSKTWIYRILWSNLRRQENHILKVIHNTNFVFEKRLYEDLLAYGGVYHISLQYPLFDLLSTNKPFIRGFIPEPCRRALTKLDLIIKSSFTQDLNENTLPNVKELFSLGVEWGVPLHWPLETTL